MERPRILTFAAGLLSAALGLVEVAGQGAVASSPAQPAAAVSGPRIAFAIPTHDFGRAKAGELVKHTFVFTNTGNATLQVSNVVAGCGCTTAGEWSRQVEPGKTGTIPVQFNSANFNGPVSKNVNVTCNDAAQPLVVLYISGTVWKPIDVAPQFVVMNLTSQAPSNAVLVRIVSNEELPLSLAQPESSNPAFGAELRTNEAGKTFDLLIKTVTPITTGPVQGQVTLKSSSTNVPVISVPIFANKQ